MTTFLLIRHAHSTANENGVLAGRVDGVELSEIGKKQSADLLHALSEAKIDRIISSPLKRCVETITPLAKMKKRKIHINRAFIEMDYGTWSGKKLRELSKRREWKEIQKRPESFSFPGGEGFSSALQRVEKELRRLSRIYPRETIVIVTHGDIIKLALTSTSSTPLNYFQKFVIDTCSLSEIAWGVEGRFVIRSNSRLVANNGKRKRLKRRRELGGGSGV